VVECDKINQKAPEKNFVIGRMEEEEAKKKSWLAIRK
jgi:hypothetical protein